MFDKYIMIRNVALLAIVYNYIHWILPVQPFIFRIILVFISLYCIMLQGKNKLIVEKEIIIFAIFNFMYYIIFLISSKIGISNIVISKQNITQIGNILCGLLSLSIFTMLSRRKIMTDTFISISSIILIISSILNFYYLRIYVIKKLSYREITDITNNASVCFLYILPLIFFQKNKILKWFTFSICIYYLLLGVKRGNILAAFIPCALFIYLTLRENKYSIFKSIIAILFVFILGVMVYHWTVNNNYLLHRINQTLEFNSSKRDIIYANAWKTWINADSVFNQIFGFGFDYTASGLGLITGHAHCDWLEILVNYGIIGVILYIIIFISFIFEIFQIHSINEKYAMISVVSIWFFKSVYSMGYTSNEIPLLMISLGNILGKQEINNYKGNFKTL